MAVKKQWICFLVNQNFMRRKNNSVELEMKKVFGEGFLGFQMAPEGPDEIYAFVKCDNYFVKVERVRHNSAIKSVLASVDSPSFLSDEEVVDFIESATPVLVDSKFKPGDFVKVTDGCYENLVGIISQNLNEDECSVMFSFHIRKFKDTLLVRDLERVSDVYRVANRSPSIRKIRRKAGNT